MVDLVYATLLNGPYFICGSIAGFIFRCVNELHDKRYTRDMDSQDTRKIYAWCGAVSYLVARASQGTIDEYAILASPGVLLGLYNGMSPYFEEKVIRSVIKLDDLFADTRSERIPKP